MERFYFGMAAPMQRQELTADEFAALRDRRLKPRKIEKSPFLPPWLDAMAGGAKILLLVLMGVMALLLAGIWTGVV